MTCLWWEVVSEISLPVGLPSGNFLQDVLSSICAAAGEMFFLDLDTEGEAADEDESTELSGQSPFQPGGGDGSRSSDKLRCDAGGW